MKYHVGIDYRKKKVAFELSNMLTIFSFMEIKVKPSIAKIIATKTYQLLNKGCMAYLDSIMQVLKSDFFTF